MAKKPAPKKMTLKKATTKRVPKTNPYYVRFGTRNELGAARSFATEPAARQAIINELNDLIPWLKRYNNAGIIEVEEAKSSVSSIVFHRDPGRLELCFDTHFDMWFAAEFWTTK